MLLHLACTAPSITSVTGWDVSETSIDQTRRCLKAMDVQREVRLELRDLFDTSGSPRVERNVGSVVLAEVLEHLEDPVEALKAVSQHMQPGAHLWVHVPIHSLVPDHLYLAAHARGSRWTRSRGRIFQPVDTAFFPMSGQTLARARKLDLTISAVVTARWPS